MTTILALTLSLVAAADATPAATPATPAAPAAPAPAAAATPAPALPRRTLDRVAAVVNGEPITVRELYKRGGQAVAQADAMRPGPERDRARAAALQAAFESIMADQLFAAEAKSAGIEVTDADVDQQIQSIVQRNNFTPEQFNQALAAEGLDLAALKARIRTQQLNFEVLRYKIGGRVTVSDEDLENYYRLHANDYAGDDEVKVRHIFIPFAGSSIVDEARAMDLANRVEQRLATGEDFATVAKQVSRGNSAEDGGDLGWLRRGTIQRELEDVAFALKDGQVSKPVRFAGGVHILKVEARRKAGGKTFEQAKEDIRGQLLDEKGEAFRKQFVAELRRQAMIEVRIPELTANPAEELARP